MSICRSLKFPGAEFPQRRQFEERIRGRSQNIFCCLKVNDFLRKLFRGIFRSGIDRDTVPEAGEFASSVHSVIFRSRKKELTATGETSFSPNTAGLSFWTRLGVSGYHESPCSMSNRKSFWIASFFKVIRWVSLLWNRVNELNLASVDYRYSVVTLYCDMRWRVN